MDLISLSKINKLNSYTTKRIWTDFFNNLASPWATGAPGSGTSATVTGTAKHPGVISISSSTTANSGFYHRINQTSILLLGGESTTFIFKTSSILTGVTRRMGFHKTNDINDSIHGVYCEIVDGVIKGKTAINSVRSETATTYNLTADTWYRLRIRLNLDATLATYTLYQDDSTVKLWESTLNSNIPKTTGLEVGHGDICTYSGTTATVIGYLDYIGLTLINSRRIV